MAVDHRHKEFKAIDDLADQGQTGRGSGLAGLVLLSGERGAPSHSLMPVRAPELARSQGSVGALRSAHSLGGPLRAPSEQPDPSVSPADNAGFRMVGGWVVPHPLATIPAVLGVLVTIPTAGLARVARRMRSGATRGPSPYLGGLPSSPRRPNGEGESRHIMCLR
jgi:hypothetical protein